MYIDVQRSDIIRCFLYLTDASKPPNIGYIVLMVTQLSALPQIVPSYRTDRVGRFVQLVDRCMACYLGVTKYARVIGSLPMLGTFGRVLDSLYSLD